MRGLLPRSSGLVGSKRYSEQIQCPLLKRGWLSEHIEDRNVFVGGLNFVYGDCCQIAEEGLKAVDLDPVGSLFGEGLERGGVGALRRSDDGGAGGLCLRLVIVVEEATSSNATEVLGAMRRVFPLRLYGVKPKGSDSPPC